MTSVMSSTENHFGVRASQTLAKQVGTSESNAKVRTQRKVHDIAMNTNAQTTIAPHQPLHFLELIASAEGPLEVLSAMQSYLNAWPKERVANLQRVDGGWAPFDNGQKPLPVGSIDDLTRFQDAIRRQCVALKQANMQLTPEIVELDEMLSIAIRFAEATRSTAFKEHSPPSSPRSALLRLL